MAGVNVRLFLVEFGHPFEAGEEVIRSVMRVVVIYGLGLPPLPAIPHGCDWGVGFKAPPTPTPPPPPGGVGVVEGFRV